MVSEYDEALKNQEATYIAYQKDLEVVNNSKLEEIQREYLNIASQILNQIKTHKSEVESLVGVIGNLGVTSGYKKVADQARVMLYIWQFLTVCALCGLIAVSYMVAFPSHNDIALNAQLTLEKTQTTQDSHVQNLSDKNKDTSNLKAKTDAGVISGKFTDNDFYHGLATRIFLSLTFGIFAAYAGKQASNFLTIEQKNRKLALELEALGPFIEPLDKADRDKFRVQVGDRSFGVPDSDFQKSREDDPVNLAGILKSKGFTDGVSDIVSAIKEAVHK